MSLTATLYQLTPSPGMLLLIIGAIAMIESLAMVGLLVPGVVLMTAAASLAGHQELSIPAVLLAAFVGAVTGDGVSFALGYRLRGRVTQHWPFSHHPEWLALGARFFQRYGSFSVFLGRFVGPVRPVIPLTAGMLHMRPRTFTWANLASAALWAPAYVLPGYLLGQAWQRRLDVPPGLERWLIILGILVISLAVTFSWLRQQVSRSGRLYRLLLSGARRYPLLRRLWLDQSEHGEVPLGIWLLLVLSLGGLSGWTILVIHHDGPLETDLAVQALFQALDTPWLRTGSEVLARLGDRYGIVALILPWAIWLLARRRLDALTHGAAGLMGIALLNVLSKELIGRARPFAPEHLADSLAYPSAHTSTTVVLLGTVAAFVASELPHRQRFWPYWAAILLALPMALSRLTLGVHWLSDVVGGALLGLVACALVQLAWQRRPRASLAPCPWTWLLLASLLLATVRVVWLPLA
ncbi:bifunctional DedA family/phosphatase PAP2 family protein [Billgrantia gudaonensis]|uniref:Undecaprenyl-diphosphatase n=1 Tax=Billgrantia gudaonensis TaxID=376427 RepID=A0A1G8TEN4_9GAMM|nr:bifunctional DedA family/phosphatase PAP2 family protein [Halomonas gudaonensis]SDJ40026.1 undecaprenyl-diphosphatase [Halomonas gudaonensis]